MVADHQRGRNQGRQLITVLNHGAQVTTTRERTIVRMGGALGRRSY